MHGQQAEAVRALGALAGIGFIWFSLMAGMFILWVYSLVEVINNDYENGSKTIWVLMLIFMGPIGLAFYWFMGRSRRVVYTTLKQTCTKQEERRPREVCVSSQEEQTKAQNKQQTGKAEWF